MPPVRQVDPVSRERRAAPGSVSSHRAASRLTPGHVAVCGLGASPTRGQLGWATAVAATPAPSQDCVRLRVLLHSTKDRKEKGKEGARPRGGQ